MNSNPSMRLPNAEKAVIDLRKLRDYCLNPLHPEGRHKARVFAATLEIRRQDTDWLCAEIQFVILEMPVIQVDNLAYGTRYTVDATLVRGDRQTVVRTGWIIRANEDFPRLVTCFVV